MASTHTNIPNDLEVCTPQIEQYIICELEGMAPLLKKLAKDARKCYEDRLEYDMETVASALFREPRAKQRNAIENRVRVIQEQAADLRQHRAALGLMYEITSATEDLELALLHVEQQRLAGVIGMADHVIEVEIPGAEMDIAGIQDEDTCTELAAALDGLKTAAWAFRDVVEARGDDRARAIDAALLRITPVGGPLPTYSSTFESEINTDSLGSIADESSSSASTLSGTGSPVPSITTSLSELSVDTTGKNEDADSMFHFERADPPSLSRLASWLGLDNDIDVALLLNTQPIQSSFAAYRGYAAQSCAREPERLKLVLPLFTFSRETLQQWQTVGDGAKPAARLDTAAALFANQVVRFLERSCTEVPWERTSDGVLSLENYEVARRRWAVVLQIFWFMQKAFCNSPMS
ncbi:hypothetical protein F4802DRAFT_496578 [Xylaria palmicola]|nr:hypothetical protein F4802DRAFT_496578 [Xylaria palmicola]